MEPVHRKGAMMRKNRILAAVCSLVFVMNCSACNGAEREILLIGQQEAERETASNEPQGTGQAGQQGTDRENMQTEGQEAGYSGFVRESAQAPQAEAEQQICVYVCGAVEAPGVVFLPAGSRAADALEAAGGFAPDAAEEAVNLAAKVSDGEKLYFPVQREYVIQAEQEKAAASGLVNINTADAAQLCTLPGIGESRAADIIAYREAHGNFAACEDIMRVSGIKESVYNKISGKITVN
ncbi:MAG: ComEA family DNA-binding protein [Blautia sp.]|nr:ComEA family DNA-binding protein [Blautia sp.]